MPATAVPPPPDSFLVAQKFFQPVYPAMDCEMVGRAQKDEIQDHFPAMFFFLDRNHDRVITRGELLDAQANASVDERRFLFAEMDENQDDRVTTEEYSAYASEAFDLLDVDGDGDLTEREVGMHSFRKVVQQ
ncbi:MAG: hypothetical protein CMK89_11630 [Pseudomonadales bacterium]|nr:hypothetical protein [Pseudomonadales bacterium]RLU03871.1 MAG: EF-hand domain-containing protein [Ketobacter sp.]